MSEQQQRRRTFTPQERELIRKTVAKDLEPNEFELLMYRAEATGLDPLAKQLYANVRRSRDNDDNWVRNVTIEAQIDGLRLTADRTGTYAPGRETVFGYDDKGNLVSATVYGRKLVVGTWHEISAVAMFAEYCQKKTNGQPNAMWARMPHSQLAKCAEALMLRKGWPADLSGIYTADEMAQADTEAPPAPAPEPPPARTPPPPAKPAASSAPPSHHEAQDAKNLEALVVKLTAAAEQLAKATGSKVEDILGEYSQFQKDGRLAVYENGPKKGQPIHFTVPGAKISRTPEAAQKWMASTLAKIEESLEALGDDVAPPDGSEA